jgi:spore coat polysaccharide biosynthesis protein SpsF
MSANDNRKIVAIVEARMTSSRLPGKHLMQVRGKPMLGYLIDRLKAVPSIDQVVIAMTNWDADDPLQAFAQNQGVTVFRGSESDVMGRVLQAAQANAADIICEVTGDCPVIDPDLVEQAIQVYLANKVAYVNNGRHGLPDGMSAQVFSTEALARSESMTDEPLDREHVTLHIKRHPEMFCPIFLVPLRPLVWKELSLTLDEKADYELLKKIIEHFGDEKPMFRCADVIELLRSRPDWVAINDAVVRKGAT